MADWIRAPSQRWFVNELWILYAFEKVKSTKPQWNSYYGAYPSMSNLRIPAPIFELGGSPATCTICDFLLWAQGANCNGAVGAAWDIICWAMQNSGSIPGSCTPNPPECFCTNLPGGFGCNAEALATCNTNLQIAEDMLGNGEIVFPCSASDVHSVICGCTPDTTGGILCGCVTSCGTTGGPCTPEEGFCLTETGTIVLCSDADALCSPCGAFGDIPGCSDFTPCIGYDGCSLIEEGAKCPAIFCMPGEDGCILCDGVWVPEELCCESCEPDGCSPYGYPMPGDYCASCDFCNHNPNASQCVNCCQTGDIYHTCGDPPDNILCTELSSNCYNCNGVYIPIWFGCEEEDPCPNPFNPDCSQGEEIVCYDYNTNDPIYYNASALGASVIIEYNNPVMGTNYSYGSVATLCEIPDILQLCVYGVDASGTKTKLEHPAQFSINETNAMITPLIDMSGFTKLILGRCTDDRKMLLTFTEGAKLSASDINASLHQLLFLIQEKEFASNTYIQVANENESGQPYITFTPPTTETINFNLSQVNVNHVLVWDGQGGFQGIAPNSLGNLISVDSLANVDLTNPGEGDFLYHDGSNWVNKDFVDLVNEAVVFNPWVEWVEYTTEDTFYNNSSPCGTNIEDAWAASHTCMQSIPKELIPNAITSFGLGYYAAERQLLDQLLNTTSPLNNKINDAIALSEQTPGVMYASLRWEISRAEGRQLPAGAATGSGGWVFPWDGTKYPRSFFDILDFDSFDPSSTATTDIAYYRPFPLNVGGATFCINGRNKMFSNNIDQFSFSGARSRASGMSGQNPDNLGYPIQDRYLGYLQNMITKKDWSAAFGYTTVHPLTNYPSSLKKYLDFVGGEQVIYGKYTYSTPLSGNSDFNVPAVVTYYLAQLWDSANNAPSHLVWDGDINQVSDLAVSGLNDTTKSYLGSNGSSWFYWRWHILGTDPNGSPSPVGDYTQLSIYAPFNHTIINSADDISILPADDYVGVVGTRNGGYSIKIDANRVFSNMSEHMGDIYDEYVFQVTMDPTVIQGSLDCYDGKCYEVVANIEKHIDGCVEGGDTNCTRTAPIDSANLGYHLYPSDFDPGVVRAWESYPYDKLTVEVRNKTFNTFDLVVIAPRLKRIGMLDVWYDPLAVQPNPATRQMALGFLTNYISDSWNADTNKLPEGTVDTANTPVALGDQIINNGMPGGSAAAFSLETAVQYIRLGIPTSVRVNFFVMSTPQSAPYTATEGNH